MNEQTYTVKATAELLDLSPFLIRKAIKNGDLKTTGNPARVTIFSLANFDRTKYTPSIPSGISLRGAFDPTGLDVKEYRALYYQARKGKMTAEYKAKLDDYQKSYRAMKKSKKIVDESK